MSHVALPGQVGLHPSQKHMADGERCRRAPASLKGESGVGLETDRRCWAMPKQGVVRVGVPTS